MIKYPYSLVILVICLLGVSNMSAQRLKPREVQDQLKSNIEILNFSSGMEVMESSNKFKDGNYRLVYFMEKGALLHYEGKYEESNEWFTKADYYFEDYYKQPEEVILTYLSNPNSADYPGEDFEALYVNYYKSLNYLALNQYNEALVEAKRMNILLNMMNDKYPDNKFDKDAFIHLMMGLIYDANSEYNDACIAYMNAYEIYNEDYKDDYNLSFPKQLVVDIVRTAKRAGLTESYNEFVELLPNKDYELPLRKGGVVVLWHNGLGPRKEAQNINFTVLNTGGFVSFHDYSSNEEYKFAEGTFKSLAVINSMITGQSGSYKMAFSKYRSLELKYTSAKISINGKDETYDLELCENVNAIAFQSHQDRKSRQFSNALARLVIRESAKMASKKAVGEGIKRIPGIGAFGGLATTASELAIDAAANSLERADLRQWSSLPHSIYYSRLYLEEGDYDLSFVAEGDEKYTESIEVSISSGRTNFKVVRTFEHNGLEEEKVLNNMLNSLGSSQDLVALVNKPPAHPPFQTSVNSTFRSNRDKFHPMVITEKWQIKEDLPGRYPSTGYKLPTLILFPYTLPILINGKREQLAANEKRRRKLLYKKQSNIPLSLEEEGKLKIYEAKIVTLYSKLKSKDKEPETGSRKKDLMARGFYD